MSRTLKYITLAILFIALSPIVYAQSQWKMQAVELQSRWADQVNPNHTHQAYPRPQLQRKTWNNLNGLWNYAITSKDTVAPKKFDGQILVPYPVESALSGVKKSLLPDQNLWYNRSFQKPILKAGERVLLHFGAVDWQATVFVNGKEIGSHTGGYTAFSFDITDYLNAGSNELQVKVYDPSDRGIGPHGKQVLNPANIYYTPSSGIWQTVWLETVPAAYISNLRTTPDIDKGVLDITVSAQNNKDIKVKVVARAKGKVISSTSGKAGESLQLSVPKAHLWSPNDPFLYDLSVELLQGNKIVDQVRSYFGMRKVSIGKDDKGNDRIFLNNKYVYNLGVLDQGFWPDGLYTAPTDEALEFDIKAIKSMNFNTIRKHIKIEPARWYYLADKLGMLVWQDFVNPSQTRPQGSQQVFEDQVKETMDQLHNYPSIITWVLFNERWGAYDQQRLTEWVKAYDPERLVNGHSGELLYVNNKLRANSENPYVSSDLTDVHSYPFPMNPLKLKDKAMVLGEFGGIGVPVPNHEWNDLQGWGYVQVTPKQLIEKYNVMVDSLKKLEQQGLSASIYTQPFDVEGEENGLMTYDRDMIKIPLVELRKINQKVIAPTTDFSKASGLTVGKDIDPDDTDERYGEFLNEFTNGRRDSAFLRRLTLIAGRQKDTLQLKRLTDAYLEILDQPFNPTNLKFFKAVLISSNEKAFMWFFNNRERIDNVLGKGWSYGKIKGIIEREEINPFTKESKRPNWDDILKAASGKYGSIGTKIVLGKKMEYYWLDKNWKNFVPAYKNYFENYVDESDYDTNNASWKIFLYSNDPEILKFATRISKINFDKYEQTAAALDTYANLLYKIGKKTEAIEQELRAADMAKDKLRYLNTAEKMKKDIPTWNEQ